MTTPSRRPANRPRRAGGGTAQQSIRRSAATLAVAVAVTVAGGVPAYAAGSDSDDPGSAGLSVSPAVVIFLGAAGESGSSFKLTIDDGTATTTIAPLEDRIVLLQPNS